MGVETLTLAKEGRQKIVFSVRSVSQQEPPFAPVGMPGMPPCCLIGSWCAYLSDTVAVDGRAGGPPSPHANWANSEAAALVRSGSFLLLALELHLMCPLRPSLLTCLGFQSSDLSCVL